MGFFWQVERGRPGRPRSLLLNYFTTNCVLVLSLVFSSDGADQKSVLNIEHQRAWLI